MILPSDPRKRDEYLKWVIDTCLISRDERRDLYERRRKFFIYGTDTDKEITYNRIESHLDLVSSFLFSGDRANFSLSAKLNSPDAEVKQFMAAADEFNNDFRDAGLFDLFAEASTWALVFDTMVLKMGWSDTRAEVTATAIEPWKFGVFAEELTEIEDQQAFCHAYHIDYDNAVQRLARAGLADRIKDLKVVNTPFESPFPEVITRMIISSTAGSDVTGNITGAVNPSYIARPSYVARVDRPLVPFYELTIWDDDCADYRVFWVIEPDIVISDSFKTIEAIKRSGGFPGARKQAEQFYDTTSNPFFPREHPYVVIRPYQLYEYFWGKAHIESLIPLQVWSNERLEQIHDILEKQAYPPRVLSGFLGLSDEKAEAFGGADSWVMDQLPNAAVNELTPKMPEDLFADYNSIGALFMEASGLTEVIQGKGSSGVRSKQHAQQLASTGGGRIKKAAIRLEAPLVRMGDLAFKLNQRNNDEEVHPDPDEQGKPGNPFYYANLGTDYTMRIDGHSHSPLFADDAKELAAALIKTQAIDREQFIRLLNPPGRDNLIHALRSRMRQEQKMKLIAAMHGREPPAPGSGANGKRRSAHEAQA